MQSLLYYRELANWSLAALVQKRIRHPRFFHRPWASVDGDVVMTRVIFLKRSCQKLGGEKTQMFLHRKLLFTVVVFVIDDVLRYISWRRGGRRRRRKKRRDRQRRKKYSISRPFFFFDEPRRKQ